MFLHNLLDRLQPPQLGLPAALWKFFIMPGPFLDHGRLWILDVYPILPWSGVMALGYAFGAIVVLPPARRRLRSMQFGVTTLILFAALRLTNAYGDPIPFRHLATHTQTAMSFLQLSKYPPSLQYICATFGILLLLFALFDTALERRWVPRALSVVEVYGRVPFFYYVPHFYILHTLALVAVLMCTPCTRFTSIRHSLCSIPPFPAAATFSLPIVYLIWALGRSVSLLPLQMVRRHQSPPPRLVAELPLKTVVRA